MLSFIFDSIHTPPPTKTNALSLTYTLYKINAHKNSLVQVAHALILNTNSIGSILANMMVFKIHIDKNNLGLL